MTIVVLGHRLNNDGTASQDMRARAECAAKEWFDNPQSDIIVCGGVMPGQEKSEAVVLKDLLTSLGVDRSAIYCEDSSIITAQNLSNAKEVIGDSEMVALVTSDYHLARALDEAEKVFPRVYGIGAFTEDRGYFARMTEKERHIIETRRRAAAEGKTALQIEKDILDRASVFAYIHGVLAIRDDADIEALEDTITTDFDVMYAFQDECTLWENARKDALHHLYISTYQKYDKELLNVAVRAIAPFVKSGESLTVKTTDGRSKMIMISAY